MSNKLEVYTLNNGKMKVNFMNYGAYITEMILSNGNNIIMSYMDPEEYLTDTNYLNCFVGPVIGRIANAAFQLDGQAYQLEKNEGNHHLHSGSANLCTKYWDVKILNEGSNPSAELTCRHHEVVGGIPGNIDVTLTYSLTEDNAFIVNVKATTDKPTLFAPSVHFNFNLDGFSQSIDQHELTIAADVFTELTAEIIPTGALLDVTHTPFDFRKGETLGNAFNGKHEQLAIEDGFDHGFLLNKQAQPDVILRNSNKKVSLEVTSTEPAVVIYTNNYLDEHSIINGGLKGYRHAGICIEMQKLPNAIHHDHFPTAVIRPGETFESESKYQFTVNE